MIRFVYRAINTLVFAAALFATFATFASAKTDFAVIAGAVFLLIALIAFLADYALFAKRNVVKSA